MTVYTWPGNIRELENVIQRAMIIAPGNVIEAAHLYLPDLPKAANIAASVGQTEGQRDRPQDIKTLERTHILETLASVKGSRKQAAERLGMSERTLRYKLQRLREEGVDPDAQRG